VVDIPCSARVGDAAALVVIVPTQAMAIVRQIAARRIRMVFLSSWSAQRHHAWRLLPVGSPIRYSLIARYPGAGREHPAGMAGDPGT
jgi:hypothetical protein